MTTERDSVREFRASVDVTVEIAVRNPDVIDRVTGPGGDEWRSQFYPLHCAEDVIEHLAENAVVNGIREVSRLEGWADCAPDDVSFAIDYITTLVAGDV